MAPPQVRLPWELEEEILTRLPPKVLVRFRTVCKQWNSLFNDRSFIYNHLSLPRPQFILLTEITIVSIDITDPTMELREIHSHPLGLSFHNANITTCDEFLVCNYPHRWEKGTALLNPLLGHVKWIKPLVDERFDVFGLGYDSSGPEKVHKMLGYLRSPSEVQTNSYLRRVAMKVVGNVYKMVDYFRSPPKEDQKNVNAERVAIYECASQTLRFIDTPDEDMRPICETAKQSHVSLNGNLYWIACNRQTREYFIQSFDFSREVFKPVCPLPFQERHDEHFLAVFKGDRFSLLTQCYLTRKIEIWVTKRKIDDGEEVVWMNLMTLTATNLPKLFNKLYGVSYIIYDKNLVICCGDDETGKLSFYVMKGRDTCSKIQLDSRLDGIASWITWFSHCAYVPNWTSVPLEFQIA
ncbi:Protein SUPPRESSOR OF NIM1 1 [Raphanus sativus]|uniref:Protein SUPPRESSOR OF NIM1 1-like n=1 Tax=Raphanus sativus TaxID=3726 RepID=A0A9W3DTK9_RAPSA|nr:protein SUPPRESSOR OF NIM1 1-like [Raphanus sativus]KAJ4893855.1 Protein SUPPRESSOR OF NIM1 1 [Raphanus sativus]